MVFSSSINLQTCQSQFKNNSGRMCYLYFGAVHTSSRFASCLRLITEVEGSDMCVWKESEEVVNLMQLVWFSCGTQVLG